VRRFVPIFRDRAGMHATQSAAPIHAADPAHLGSTPVAKVASPAAARDTLVRARTVEPSETRSVFSINAPTAENQHCRSALECEPQGAGEFCERSPRNTTSPESLDALISNASHPSANVC